MATELSTVLTNEAASPRVFAKSGNHGGRKRVMMDAFELTVTPATGGIVLLDKLPTNAVIQRVSLIWDDLGTTTPFDVGIYDNDQVAKDIDIFASAVAGGTASTSWQDLTVEAGAGSVALLGGKLYEWAGDSSDPNTEYYVGMTFGTVTAGATGTVAYMIEYAID